MKNTHVQLHREVSPRDILTSVALTVLLSAALLSMTGGGSVEAATQLSKGGGGTSPTMAILLNGVQVTSVPAGSGFTLTGSGFTPGQQVYLNDLCYGAVNVNPDSNGAWSLPSPAGNYPMSCKADALVQRNRKFVVVATITWSVVAP